MTKFTGTYRSVVISLRILFIHLLVQGGETRVFLSPDDMAGYQVGNGHHCQRICWYRALCTAYSYRSRSTEGENCVLHSSHFEVSTAPLNRSADISGWVRRDLNAANQGSPQPSNLCSSRPCGDTQICVPLPSSHLDGYKCLSIPAVCPSSVDPAKNASTVVQGHFQGDSATVKCDAGFLISPTSSSDQIVCQVNSEWTRTANQCLRAEWFLPPGNSIMAELPWALTTGWGVCVKGTMVSSDRMTFDFLLDQASLDLPLHVDLRFADPGVAVYDSRINGDWQGLQVLGNISAASGEKFAISFELLDSGLSVFMLFGNTSDAISYMIPVHVPGGATPGDTEGAVDLLNVAALVLGGTEVQMHYVNVVSKCTAAQFSTVEPVF